MRSFFVLAFLFFLGSVSGWVLELIFRRFFSAANPERKWINPGFLNGPYLPLYGFGVCLLYLLSELDLSFVPSVLLQRLLLFAIMTVTMTVTELIAGEIFILGMNIKLWDYSRMWGNFRGVICPLFSLIWGVMGVGYYFLLHPYILGRVTWFEGHTGFLFVVGMFYGIMAVDFCVSANLAAKVRRFAADNGLIVRYEELKLSFMHARQSGRAVLHFAFSFLTDIPLPEQLRRYRDEHPIIKKMKKRKARVKDDTSDKEA